MRHIPMTVAAVAAPMLFCSSFAVAQFTFAPTINYNAGAQPGGAATGDLDGDGDVDLATGVRFPSRVAILINDGTGAFAVGPTIPMPAGSQPEEIVAGDLDGDGDMDLAVILRNLLQVRVYLNQGGLVFVEGSSASIGANGRGMDIADHDGDGDLDLAIANRGSNTASVLTNDGAANFTTQTLTSPGEPRAASFGDLDGDGDRDLAVTNNDAFNVRLFRNERGVFVDWQTLSTAPNQAEGVDIADLDNDGDMDIATGAEDDNVGVNNAVVFINGGGGAFGPATPYNTGGVGTSGCIAMDMDCDGLADLALGNQDSNNFTLLKNLGGGVFGGPQLRPCGINPETIAAADLDGDGLADLVSANRDSSDMSVLINDTCTPMSSPDLNDDGAVDASDLAAMLAAWGPCVGCPADLDGDGVVGPADLSILLAAWGPVA